MAINVVTDVAADVSSDVKTMAYLLRDACATEWLAALFLCPVL
jgi:1,4-dihydroxy-2-naphthoate octaprenyltransferase